MATGKLKPYADIFIELLAAARVGWLHAWIAHVHSPSQTSQPVCWCVLLCPLC